MRSPKGQKQEEWREASCMSGKIGWEYDSPAWMKFHKGLKEVIYYS